MSRNGPTDIIYVDPNLTYNIKFVVLRGDLDASYEKVEDIKFNDKSAGECNPPKGQYNEYQCDFYDCEIFKEISSVSGEIEVVTDYGVFGADHACDCDKITWDCSPKAGKSEGNNEPSVAGRAHMMAAARIVLTPKLKPEGRIM